MRWTNGGEVQLGRRRKTETSVRWMNGGEVHLKGEYCVPEINMYWFGGLVAFVLAFLSESNIYIYIYIYIYMYV